MVILTVHLLDIKSYASYFKSFLNAFRLVKLIVYNSPNKNLLAHVTMKKNGNEVTHKCTCTCHSVLVSLRVQAFREKGLFSYSGGLLCQNSVESPHIIVHHKLQ